MSEKEVIPVAESTADTERGVGAVLTEEKGLFRRMISRRNDLNELGKDMLQQSQQYDKAQLEADAIKVRRKLDSIVLPMMMITYMLSFLDKQTLNYSNAYGLQPDTNMKGDNYSWVASALYFGWLCGAWPWNLLLQRVAIGKLVGGMLFVWGVVCMLQAAVFNFSGFFAIRFFLGMLEGCISPAWVLLTSMLWTRKEQTLRSSIWLCTNGVSNILGALLAYAAGVAQGLAVAQWKLIFLIVGALTFVWGFLIVWYLPDGPHNAKMLSEYERVVAVWRVSDNKMGLKDATFRSYQIKEAALDGRCWLLWMTGIAFGILNGAVTNFMSAIIKGFNFDALRTTLLQAPGGAFAVVACLSMGFLSQLPNMVGGSIMIGCLPGMAGLIGILTINIEHRYALVGMCWMLATIGSPIVLNWTVPGINIAGHTKRSTVLGVYFVCFVVGNIVGPQLFLASEVPRYPTAIKGLLGTYCSAIFLQGLYTLWCWWENKQRDKMAQSTGAVEEEGALGGFEDLTDKENKYFRYKL
ncbi:MFS general substrate transporter [Durotheca rogersii]|uniref:MFS general substrate transporter n=1 Tax=Durotheca rogersii TaxID=419775 RepID=UPI00221F002F|nr:MFS general substrate transporter [Durotheca rogersii]KAI5866278.1 MFS general substrate transporter [Durotheca rogersii]